MDLRVLVLTADLGLSELLRTQVENLGCHCTLRSTYHEAGPGIEWADAAIIDLAGGRLDELNLVRVEAPRLKILAIASDAEQGEAARSAGADQVLVEPFAVAEVIEAVRALGPRHDAAVIDLRTGAASASVPDDAPWWASR